jgi:hypothetical protein
MKGEVSIDLDDEFVDRQKRVEEGPEEIHKTSRTVGTLIDEELKQATCGTVLYVSW